MGMLDRRPCYTRFARELEARAALAACLPLTLSMPLLLAMCTVSWIVCQPPPNQRNNYVHAPYGSGSDEDDGAESNRLLSGTYWGHADGESDDDRDSEDRFR